MSFKKFFLAISAVIAIIAISSAVILYINRSWVSVPGIPAPAEWREEFKASPGGETALPDNWVLKTKPGTKSAIFTVKKHPENSSYFLHMEADKASGSLVTQADAVDLRKTPYFRWRWKAGKLPEGADGRIKNRDDQAIGIYIGAGNPLSNKSISYRWDTDTPRGESGSAVYGLGAIKTKWYTLRNKEDVSNGAWITEERNVAEDFKNAWGFYPAKVYISVSCNSQYTGSSASADLDWVEFRQAPVK